MLSEKNAWLISRPIAHRGLWGNGNNAVENSLTAFRRAVEFNYPVEIDLFLSTDGVLYCFHDDDLFRMTGEKGKIYEKSSEFIDSLFLAGTDEKIPKFTDVLSLAENKIPLLIEIKNQPNGKLATDLTVKLLKNHKGEFAVQSFNPIYLLRVKKQAPEFTRGILGNSDKNDLKGQNFVKKLALSHLFLNFLVKPDFISYNKTGLPLKKKIRKNKPVICWTVLSEEERKRVAPYSNNIIFEGFIPEK